MTDLQRPSSGAPASTPDTGMGDAGNGATGTVVEKGKEAASTTAEAGRQIATEAAGASRQVASEAAGKAGEVAREASNQVSTLVEQAQVQLRQQASTQTERAAGGIRSFSEQLRSFGEGQPQAGPAADCVRQLAQKLASVADGLDQRGFEGAVSDVRQFARTKPGLFLLGATAAGFAVGRIGRGLQAANQQGGQGQRQVSAPSQPQLSASVPAPAQVPEVI